MNRNQHAAKGNKKGISFHDFSEVYRVVPRRSMYTVDEKKATWSEKADYDKYRKEVRQSVKQLEEGRRVSDALHTTLGITHLLAEERKVRAINRVAAWDIVLNEQELQQQLGKRNSILLADLYKSVSADAVSKAQRAAQEVADYATHTLDDIEVMEPSHKLQEGTNARRRSSSCNNMDFGNLLAELSLSYSSLNESSLSVANWA